MSVFLEQVAEERISNIRTVRAFAQEKKEAAAYNSKIEEVLQLMRKEAAVLGVFWGFVSSSSCQKTLYSKTYLSIPTGNRRCFIVDST